MGIANHRVSNKNKPTIKPSFTNSAQKKVLMIRLAALGLIFANSRHARYRLGKIQMNPPSSVINPARPPCQIIMTAPANSEVSNGNRTKANAAWRTLIILSFGSKLDKYHPRRLGPILMFLTFFCNQNLLRNQNSRWGE